MAAATDLTTLAAVKSWLGIEIGTGSDTQIEALISAASQFIETWTNRDFVQTTYSTVLRANGQSVALGDYPIVSVTSILWPGTSVPPGDPIAGTPGYYIEQPNMIRLYGYCFPSAPVQVNFTAGYATIPLDIAQTCIELTGEAFKRSQRIGMLSKTLNNQETVNLIRDVANATVLANLAQYKKTIPQ